MKGTKESIHFLLSIYSQSLIDCYNDGLLTKTDVINEAETDLNIGMIDEIEYNVIRRHLELY